MTNQPSDKTEIPQNDSHKQKRGKKVLTVILCCFLALVIGGVSLVFGMWYSGKKGLTQKSATLTPGEGFTAIINQDNTVVYNGKVYKYNENVAAMLFLGVDNDKKVSGGVSVTGRAGQADAIYLCAVDTTTGKVTVVGIPRDTVTDIELYSKSGGYIGTEDAQICLAYAYGDGKHTSCENMTKAVSRLLYGMPVSAYFAVDNKSIPALHNAVGPITVIPNETLKTVNHTFYKDTPVRLTGSNVYEYLQARDSNNTNASYLRMQRQLDYLKKYCAAAVEKTKGNLLFPVELYNKVQKNAVTDIDVNKITYMTSVIMKNKGTVSMEFISLEGKQIKGDDGFAEFYPDEEKLFETVLKVYYTEVR